MSKRQKAFNYCRSQPVLDGLGDETIKRLIAVVAYFSGIPSQSPIKG